VQRTVSVGPFADAEESRVLRRLRDPLTGLGNREVFAAASREPSAGQLDLEIIAEGLETAAHLAQLRSLGCHVGQGYYFAKPGPADSLQFEDLGRVSA
jgi:hypothetical protein